MNSTRSRAAGSILTAVIVVLAAFAVLVPQPGRAGASPIGQRGTDAEVLVTSSGTEVTVPFPGVDRHGWSGSTGTADALADVPADVPGAALTDVPAELPADAPADELGTMSIIGTDDTVRVADVGAYPARAIGLITRGGFPHCTGALIGSDTVLTAGHCLHDTGGQGWWSGLAFHTRLITDDHQICTPRADGLMAFRGWVEQGDERHDVGLMKLNCQVGETVGWLGVAPATRSLTGTEVTIQGFPGERLAELWLSVGPVLHDDRHLVFYDNDTLTGMSGSALQLHRPQRGRGCAGQCTVAVHAYGLHGEGLHTQHNHGARLTPGKAAALRAATRLA